MGKIKFWVIASLFVPLLSGCGENGIESGSGTGSSGNNDGSPTLGITSIEKTSPSPSKATLTKRWLSRGRSFLLGSPVLAQTPCPPASFKHTFRLADGTIWMTQAYLILDEIEFEIPGQPGVDGPERGPFAFDLTATDPDVPQDIRLDVPAGNYSGMKFRVKRLDDALEEQPKNLGNHLDAFMKKLFDDGTKRRPSVWIEGTMQVDEQPCHSFTFVTDQAWRITLPFLTGVTVDPTQLDVVVLLDLPQAFKNAEGVTVEGLIDEIGQSSLGEGFLDGRTKDPGFGTVNAKKVAEKLPAGFKVFAQTAGTFAADPGVAPNAVPILDDTGPVIHLE